MCESYPLGLINVEEDLKTPVETIIELSAGLGLPFDIMERIIKYKDLLESFDIIIYLTRQHVTHEDAPTSDIIRYMKSVFYPSDYNRVGMIFTIGNGNNEPEEYTCAEFPDVKAAVSGLHGLYT